MNTGSKGVQGAYLGGGQPGANAPMMFNPSLYNPGIQIVVVHQVTAMMILHIIDQDEKLITETSNLRGITVQARNHMPTILPIITILVIIMDMGEMKGDMIEDQVTVMMTDVLVDQLQEVLVPMKE